MLTRTGHVAGGVLVALADIDDLAGDPVGVDERNRAHGPTGVRPALDAAGELADEVLVADVEALADELVAILALVEHEDERPLRSDQPAEPTGEHGAQRCSTTTPERDRSENAAIGRTSTTTPPAAR